MTTNRHQNPPETCKRHLTIGKAFGWLNSVLLSASDTKVGGQAIIEGVMMRSKEKISWAVKRQNGEIAIESFPFESTTKRHKALSLPVVRGAVQLIESMVLGYRALSRSAELISLEQTEKPKRTWKDFLANWASMFVALSLSVGLFMFLPIWLLTFLGFEKSALTFNALAGSLRVGLFLSYISGISLWKDVRRLYEYHGAEHKAIFTFEDGKDLSLDNMRAYTTHHPRCGTSFLLLVTLICIVLFAIIDSVLISLFFSEGYSAPTRLLVHLMLFPLVSGISYEVLKLSDRYQHVPLVRALIRPGLWLQRITTREPDDHQLTIAAEALKAVV